MIDVRESNIPGCSWSDFFEVRGLPDWNWRIRGHMWYLGEGGQYQLFRLNLPLGGYAHLVVEKPSGFSSSF